MREVVISIARWNDGTRLRILLLQRPVSDRFKGEWCLPGGKPEQGELMEDTFRRELKEETGIEAGIHRFRGPLEVSWRGETVRFYVFDTDVTTEQALNVKLEQGHGWLGYGWFDTGEAWSLVTLPPLKHYLENLCR